MSAWLIADSVLIGVAVLVFGFLLGDAIGRKAHRFPDLTYGGRGIDRTFVRHGWVLILAVGAWLGHTSPLVLTSSAATMAATSDAAAIVLQAEGQHSNTTSYESSRGIYLNHQVRLTAERLTESSQVRIPILFLVAIASYVLLVIRWPSGVSESDSRSDPQRHM